MTDAVMSSGDAAGLAAPDLVVVAVAVALWLAVLAFGLLLWTAHGRRSGAILGPPGAPDPFIAPDPPSHLVPILFCEEDGRRLLRWGELITSDER
jgi:hypothetical protein